MDDEDPSETPPGDDDDVEANFPDTGEEQGDGSQRQPNVTLSGLWSGLEPPVVPSFEIPEHILRGFQFDTSHLHDVIAEASRKISDQLDTAVAMLRYAVDVAEGETSLAERSGTDRHDRILGAGERRKALGRNATASR